MRPVTQITIAGIRLAMLVLAVYWAAIAIGTHLPAQLDFSPQVSDKVKHFSAFAGLSLLLAYVTNSAEGRWRSSLVRFGSIALVVTVYAGLDEWTQQFVPGRVADPYDFVADVAGMLCGLTGYVIARATVGDALRRRFDRSA